MAFVLGIGNPLLDICADVPKELLDKYGLKPGNAILAEEKHMPIREEMPEPVLYIAGGSAQNSIRACQWMIQTPDSTGYIGCIGNDANGKRLTEAASKDGVKVHYSIDETTPTGTCFCLITDKERSMVANLAAANNYKADHFNLPETQEIVNKATHYCATGFFLTVAPDVLLDIGKRAAAENKPLLVNLAAPFIIDFFWDKLAAVLPYVDVVVCNETEAAAFGKKNDWGDNLDEIAQKLCAWEKVNKERKRTVVFTLGCDPGIVVHDDKVIKIAPTRVPSEEIVDLNGAGDSFFGGFLSQFVQNKPIDVCVRAGHYCAGVTIRTSGTQFSGKPSFSE